MKQNKHKYQSNVRGACTRLTLIPQGNSVVQTRLLPAVSWVSAVGVSDIKRETTPLMAAAAEQVKEKKKNRFRGRFFLTQTGSLDAVAASGKF